MAVPITDGVPGTPVTVPGTDDLTGVACPSATNCEAVGGGVVVPITNGVPGAAISVQGNSAGRIENPRRQGE